MSLRSENKLEREELSKAFQDFQRDEELEDGLSHALGQSGALLLQSSTDALHGHVHVIGDLRRERQSKDKRSSAVLRRSFPEDPTCFSSCL